VWSPSSVTLRSRARNSGVNMILVDFRATVVRYTRIAGRSRSYMNEPECDPRASAVSDDEFR
jgi:hypothetical protein